MLKKRKVIHGDNRYVGFPISSTAVVWLLLDRLDLPGWAIGATWTIWGLYWIMCIVCIFTQETHHVKFEDD